MRKLVGIIAAAIFFIVVIQTGFTSCTKTNTVTDTVTVIKRDTVTRVDTLQLKDTAVTLEILTANPWKLLEVRALVANGPVLYLRGGSANTLNFDNEFITFNPNHTGVYTDNFGTSTTLSWNFTDATNTTLQWTWNLSTPVVITWEHLFYKNAALHYDEYYNQSGTNTLGAEIRIPK